MNRRQGLMARVLSVALLDGALAERMYRLFARYYGGSSQAMFLEDLQAKDYCLLLENDRNQLCGFTTLAVSEHQVEGKRLRSLFSGDTIIHHEYWGSQALPQAWCQLAGSIKSQAPELPLYWFLIVKGHRTYRYLKLFSRTYYPAPGWSTPAPQQRIMDFLARDRFGKCYDPERGVIRFPQSRGYLRPEWVALDRAHKNKPEVAFFLEKNPGHGRGDELVCLTELDEKNLKRQALQAFLGGQRI